jgi:hypothetical protein
MLGIILKETRVDREIKQEATSDDLLSWLETR